MMMCSCMQIIKEDSTILATISAKINQSIQRNVQLPKLLNDDDPVSGHKLPNPSSAASHAGWQTLALKYPDVTQDAWDEMRRLGFTAKSADLLAEDGISHAGVLQVGVDGVCGCRR